MLGKVFHSPKVAAAGSWLGIFTAISGGLGWLAKNTPEWFGALTWPQTVLAGTAMATILLLTLSIIAVIGAAAYRLFKPVPSSPTLASEPEQPSHSAIRTFWSRTGGSSTKSPNHIVAGLVIAPQQRLTNVRVYLSHAAMVGWSPQPPRWGELSDRRLIGRFEDIQAGDQRQVKLFERDWDAISTPVMLADHDFGAPDQKCWPFKRLRVELFSDELTETRDLALFMPGYSVVMFVDALSVEMSGNAFAGPLSLNDPRIRNDGETGG